jgi:hypothetical protein
MPISKPKHYNIARMETASPRAVMRCPYCRSTRMEHSHRQGMIDGIFSHIGAEVCRCYDCRHRYAFFRFFAWPLGVHNEDGVSILLLFVFALSLCLVVVWWMSGLAQ